MRPTPTGRIIVEALRGHMPGFVDTGLDVVHVEDVAKGHISALRFGRIGERYILGGENVSLATLLEEVARLSGRRAPHIKFPHRPLFPFAWANEALARFTKKEPFLNLESLRLAAVPMYFDDSKARRELGYQTRPHYEAVTDAVRWFQGRECLEGLLPVTNSDSQKACAK